MSAFFLAINLDHKPFDRKLAEQMNSQLARYGRDGNELVVKDHYALGYQRYWSVPEEIGEQQPLYDADADIWLMLHGRIDNRSELLGRLNSQHGSDTDAQLLLSLYKAFGQSIFKDIIGPFVFVIYSPLTREVVAARDCMGGRYLVYAVRHRVLLLSTYEMALAAHPAVGYQINPAKAVKLLTHAMDGDPASMLAGVSPLWPGHVIRHDGAKMNNVRFYLPDPGTRIRHADDREYAEEFKHLLARAVQRRLRSSGPIGSMLSGGLDSVPLSILAAQQLREKNQRLAAFSWVYDRYPDADERLFSVPVCEDHGIDPHWVNCDSVWPQLDHNTACNPIIPFSTPYGAFNQALFARAEEQGMKVLLSGMGGDMYYTGTENLPYELLRGGRLKSAWRELRYAWRSIGSGRKFIRAYFLNPLSDNTDLAAYAPEWLNDDLKAQMRAEPSWLAKEQSLALRPAQYFNVLGTLEGEDMSYGRYFETSYGVERRYPFRDRELAEFMLAIPTEQLFYDHYARPIVRRAFAEEFRPELLRRWGKTNFQPVVSAGIERDDNYRAWLEGDDLSVSKYVNKCYLSTECSYFDAHKHVPWRCAYYEFWKTSCYTVHAIELGSNND